jgi:hypothetical protein
MWAYCKYCFKILLNNSVILNDFLELFCDIIGVN